MKEALSQPLSAALGKRYSQAQTQQTDFRIRNKGKLASQHAMSINYLPRRTATGSLARSGDNIKSQSKESNYEVPAVPHSSQLLVASEEMPNEMSFEAKDNNAKT